MKNHFFFSRDVFFSGMSPKKRARESLLDVVLSFVLHVLRPEQRTWHELQRVSRAWSAILKTRNSLRQIRVVVKDKFPSRAVEKLGASLFHLETGRLWNYWWQPTETHLLNSCLRLRHLSLPLYATFPTHVPDLSNLTCLVSLVLPVITTDTLQSLTGLCALERLEFTLDRKPSMVRFTNLTNLTSLGLGHQAVAHCQQMDFVVSNLTSLRLSSCKLKKATRALAFFPPMEKLQFGFLRDREKEDGAMAFWNVMHHERLRSLQFSFSHLPSSGCYSRFSALEEISLQCPAPASFCEIPRLSRLILEHNDLEFVPACTTSLTELRVWAGYGEELLSSILRLSTLEVLHINFALNALLLQELPCIHKKLPRLRVLGVPEFILSMPNLHSMPGISVVPFSLQ